MTVLCLAAGGAIAQTDESAADGNATAEPAGGGSGQAETASESGSGGLGVNIPYSRILRNAQLPFRDLRNDVRVGGRFPEKVGPGDVFVQTAFIESPRIYVPLGMSFRPESALLKIGRLYLDIGSLSGSLLYSDNVDFSEHNRKDGVIGIVELTTSVMYQVTDTAWIGVNGTIVYLPFRGEIGIAGFKLFHPLLEFNAGPIFRAQAAYDFVLGGWDIKAIDDVRVASRRFGAGASLDMFAGESFDEEDRAGRYVFRGPHGASGASSGDVRTFSNDRFGLDFTEGRNLVGAVASRLLPTETRMEVGGYHANYWYSDTHNLTGSLPQSRDTVFGALRSERENMRFKPYVEFHASRYNYNDGWQQQALGGIEGPITENLYLQGEGGYLKTADSPFETYTARVRLRHMINPLTDEGFQYNRNVTEPDETLEESYSYFLHHLFREDLGGQFYGSIAKYTDFRGFGRSGVERRAALRFVYRVGQRTTWRISGTYLNSVNDNSTFGDAEEWIGRSEIFYVLTSSVRTRLIYQYRTRSSSVTEGSFYENLVILTVSKYF